MIFLSHLLRRTFIIIWKWLYKRNEIIVCMSEIIILNLLNIGKYLLAPHYSNC